MSPATSSRRQAEVVDAFVRLLGELDIDGPGFDDRLAQALCATSALERAVVFRYDHAQRRVRTTGAYRVDVAQYAHVPVTIESADIARDALLDDRVVIAEPPFDDRLPKTFLPLVADAPLVAVPLAAAGRMIGVVLGQGAPGSGPPEPAVLDALWSLGKTAALALTAQIATQQQGRARQLEERIDLAREIHDRVVQRLFGVSLALSASAGDLAGEERVRCAEEIQGAMADLRTALHRPLGRDVRATGSTLARELDRLARSSPEIGLEVRGAPEATPAQVEDLAQAVLAEAVANARRHADVEHLQVEVGAAGETFSLVIANDGVRGVPGPKGTGMGLRLAAFSALARGGLVEFGPRGDGWWQVRLVLPLEAAA